MQVNIIKSLYIPFIRCTSQLWYMILYVMAYIESAPKKATRGNTVQTLFLSLTSNPVTLTRCSTIGKCPFLAALWSAVSFASVRSNTWPPIMGARYWATPTWPPSADKWKALNPPYIDRPTQHKQCIFRDIHYYGILQLALYKGNRHFVGMVVVVRILQYNGKLVLLFYMA